MSHPLQLLVAIVATAAIAAEPALQGALPMGSELHAQSSGQQPAQLTEIEACHADAEGWAGWCQEAETELVTSHHRLMTVRGHRALAQAELIHCEALHGDGAGACQDLRIELRYRELQRDDVLDQQTDAVVQMQHACHEAERTASQCERIASRR